MSFYYAQDKDAFKDIDDLRLRNMPTFAQAMAMKQPSGVFRRTVMLYSSVARTARSKSAVTELNSAKLSNA